MERDISLIDEAKRGSVVIRVYRWDGPWVSLGRFQAPEDAVLEAFDRVVIRPTGGKAVLHGHDLTVAIAAPWQGRSVKRAYEENLDPLIQAMNRCGLKCGLASCGRSHENSGPDCFASTSPFDIVGTESGAKVAGAAMRVVNGAILLQVSIPYGEPLVDPASVLNGSSRGLVMEWRWAALSEELGGSLEVSSPVCEPALVG